MEPGSPRAVAGAAAVGRFREESRLLLSEMDLDGACFPARLARRRGPATVALPLLAWRLLDWCTGHCRPCCGLVVLRRLRRVGGPLLLHQRGGGVPPWSSVVARRARSAGCALRLRPCTPLERAIASRAAAQTPPPGHLPGEDAPAVRGARRYARAALRAEHAALPARGVRRAAWRRLVACHLRFARGGAAGGETQASVRAAVAPVQGLSHWRGGWRPGSAPATLAARSRGRRRLFLCAGCGGLVQAAVARRRLGADGRAVASAGDGCAGPGCAARFYPVRWASRQVGMAADLVGGRSELQVHPELLVPPRVRLVADGGSVALAAAAALQRARMVAGPAVVPYPD